MEKQLQIETETFLQNFEGGDVPPALLNLLEFQNKEGYRSYSKWFSLTTYDDFFKEKFGAQRTFIPFATANSTGSAYGFWIEGAEEELENRPIVFWGDSGAKCVMAENLRGLLQFLALDLEPQEQGSVEEMIFDSAGFKSEKAQAYLEWLESQGIERRFKEMKEFKDELAQVQRKFEPLFKAWLAKYYP